jgi:UDP-N-acetylmuramate--alanine ligase
MKIHFIGIGGIGMSGLSSMYHAMGYEVSGSDRGADKPENQRILAPLRKQGIRIYPQDGSFYEVEKSDFVVYSSAIEHDNPDFAVLPETVRRLHRAEALQKIILQGLNLFYQSSIINKLIQHSTLQRRFSHAGWIY